MAEIELFETIVDCRLTLPEALMNAVGERNVIYLRPNVTNPKNFPLTVVGVWMESYGIVPLLNGETHEEAAARVVKKGYVSENMRAIIAFLEQHPDQVARYEQVAAAGDESRWLDPEFNEVFVPAAVVGGRDRNITLTHYGVLRHGPRYGLLVSKPRK